jgi:hypothetical protein
MALSQIEYIVMALLPPQQIITYHISSFIFSHGRREDSLSKLQGVLYSQALSYTHDEHSEDEDYEGL